MNNKIQLTSVFLLLACSALPLAKISTNTTKKHQQSPPLHTHVVAYQKNIHHTRSVTKFKSTNQSLQSQHNWFNKLKEEIKNSNISAAISNTSTFNMNIKYSGFNSFGFKVKHVVKSVGGDLKQPNLNIGVSQFPKMQVQVPGHSSAWEDYVSDLNEDKIPDATKISESSITYKLIVTGSTDYETATFVMSYMLRNSKANDQPKHIQLGHFAVYNVNNNGKNWATSVAGGVTIGVLIAVVLAVIVIGSGVGVGYAKRASIKRYFAATLEDNAPATEATLGNGTHANPLETPPLGVGDNGIQPQAAHSSELTTEQIESANKLKLERQQEELANKQRFEREQIESANRLKFQREQIESANRLKLEREQTESANKLKLQREQDELANKELANKELADKELADKELADKELADKELADKELADKELANKLKLEGDPAETDKQLLTTVGANVDEVDPQLTTPSPGVPEGSTLASEPAGVVPHLQYDLIADQDGVATGGETQQALSEGKNTIAQDRKISFDKLQQEHNKLIAKSEDSISALIKDRRNLIEEKLWEMSDEQFFPTMTAINKDLDIYKGIMSLTDDGNWQDSLSAFLDS